MIIEELKNSMPPLPPYKGKYRVIYLEPIRHSGERLSIAIMAEGGEAKRVLPTISTKKLKCMYGAQAVAIKNLIGLIVDNANKYLQADHPIEQWQPPFTGVEVSPVKNTRFQKNIDNMLYQAITSYSSLYDGEIVENINQLLEQNDEEHDEATAQLITSVKNNLGKAYQKHFRKKVSLLKGDKITIDYLGVKFNADIANFNVTQPGTAERNAKAKLLDIETLRDERSKEKINNNLTVGFMLFQPDSPNRKTATSIRQIIHMAEARNIKVDVCNKPVQLADLIRERDPLTA